MLFKKRIFIVEDNLENRVVYRMLLAKHGATVEFSRWGADVIESLQQFAPVDLIILDLMLPQGRSGYGIFEQVRTSEAFNHVPIIAVSAADPSVAVPRVKALGFRAFFSKPIDGDHFAEQLTRILEANVDWIEA